MKYNTAAGRSTVFALLAITGMTGLPVSGWTAEDLQAEREARRVQAEVRREQELGRRDMESREQAQAEALRGQEDAIRRLETTRARLEASSQQTAQQSVEQARLNSYLYGVSGTAPLERPRAGYSVNNMILVSVSERLGSYFGTKSGVLVVRAGPEAPFGLQDGDVILSIDGRVPTDGQHAGDMLRSYQAGERVKLQLQRERSGMTVDTESPGRTN